MIKNSIRVISPYKWNGMWVFDDKEVGLKREPFVFGADDLCEAMSQGAQQFTLLFSEIDFPGHQLHLKLKRIEKVGQTYDTDDGREAWLCPALLLYFEKPPEHIYAQATHHRELDTKRSYGKSYEQHFSRVQAGRGTCK